MSRHYHGLLFTPMKEPAIPKSTPLAPQPPYVGEELARLTSMTPFDGGQFSPVYMKHPYADQHSRLIFGGNPPPSQFYHGVSSLGGYAGAFNATSDGYGITDAGITIGARTYELKSYGSSGTPAGLSTAEKTQWKDSVKVLQNALVSAGLLARTYRSANTDKDSADGLYGSRTEDAVKELQKRVGLSQTGKIDQKTAKALWMYKTATATGVSQNDAAETAKAHVAASQPNVASIIKKEEKKEGFFDNLGDTVEGFLEKLRRPTIKPYRPTTQSPAYEKKEFPWGAAIFGTVAVVGILAGFAYLTRED